MVSLDPKISGLRYNLGCGDDIRPYYCNVDFRKTGPSVLEYDLSKFPWTFAEDESADEVMMLDFLEHFPYRDTKRILMECYRILKPGGELVIQVPDAEILSKVMLEHHFQCNRCGTWINDMTCVPKDTECRKCNQQISNMKEAAMMRLFGGQDYPGNTHYTCFTRVMLALKAGDCGFQGMTLEEEEHQAANWNFKARFFKGDVW